MRMLYILSYLGRLGGNRGRPFCVSTHRRACERISAHALGATDQANDIDSGDFRRRLWHNSPPQRHHLGRFRSQDILDQTSKSLQGVGLLLTVTVPVVDAFNALDRVA